MMKEILNSSAISRHLGLDRNAIRLGKKIPTKHIPALDKLFFHEIPNWWRKYRREITR